MTTENQAPEGGPLRDAAQAVLDRWDSPTWQWTKQGATADLMADLRAALAAQPQQAPQPRPADSPMDEDERWTLDRAADLLDGYAEHIRSVGADNLQYWPYLPEVEMVAKGLRTIAAPAQCAAEGDDEQREPAPPHSLPMWIECARIVENHEFRQRAAAGLEGAVLDLPEVTPAPTALHRFIHEYDDSDPYRSDWFMHRLELVVKEAQANVQPKGTSDDLASLNAELLAECARLRECTRSVWAKAEAAAERRGLKLVMQMPHQHVELIDAAPATPSPAPARTAAQMEAEPRTLAEAIAKIGELQTEVDAYMAALRAVPDAASQAPAVAHATGDTNGRRDGLRSAVHGRVPVGGYTAGALADLLFASRDAMSLNAELDLTMDQLVRLTQAVLTAVPATVRTQAAQDVLAERQRQITVEGWTPEHDDAHRNSSMATAASCYAWAASGLGWWEGDLPPAPPEWPWDREWWKPSEDPRRNLVKAGALILAEIERLDRASQPPVQGSQP